MADSDSLTQFELYAQMGYVTETKSNKAQIENESKARVDAALQAELEKYDKNYQGKLLKSEAKDLQKDLKANTKAQIKDLKASIQVSKEERSSEKVLNDALVKYGTSIANKGSEGFSNFGTDIEATQDASKIYNQGTTLLEATRDSGLSKGFETAQEKKKKTGEASAKASKEVLDSLTTLNNHPALVNELIDDVYTRSNLDEKLTQVSEENYRQKELTQNVLKFETAIVGSDTTSIFNSIYDTTKTTVTTVSKESAVGKIKAAKEARDIIQTELNTRSGVISEIKKAQRQETAMRDANEQALNDPNYTGPTYTEEQIKAQNLLASSMKDAIEAQYGTDFLSKSDIKSDKKAAKEAMRVAIDDARTDFVKENLSKKMGSQYTDLLQNSSGNSTSLKQDYNKLKDKLSGKTEGYKTKKKELQEALNQELHSIDNDLSLDDEDKQRKRDEAYSKYWNGTDGTNGMTALKKQQKETEKSNSEELKWAREYYNRSKALSDDEFYASQWEDEEKLNSTYQWGKFISHEKIYDFDGVLESDNFWDALGSAMADQTKDVVLDTFSNIGQMFKDSFTSFKLIQRPADSTAGGTQLDENGKAIQDTAYVPGIIGMLPIQGNDFTEGAGNTKGSKVKRWSFEGKSGPAEIETQVYTNLQTPVWKNPDLKTKLGLKSSTKTNGSKKPESMGYIEDIEDYQIDVSNANILDKGISREDVSFKPKTGSSVKEITNAELTPVKEGSTSKPNTFRVKATEEEPIKLIASKIPSELETVKTGSADLKAKKANEKDRDNGGSKDTQDEFIDRLPKLIPAFTTTEGRDNLTSEAIHRILTTYPLLNQSLYMLYVPHLDDNKPAGRVIWSSYLVTGITIPGFSRQTTNETYGQTLLSLIAENNVKMEGKASIKILCDRGMRVYSELSRLAGTSIESDKYSKIEPKFNNKVTDKGTGKWFENLSYEKVYNLSSMSTYPNLNLKKETNYAYLQILDGRYINKEFFLEERDFDTQKTKILSGDATKTYLEEKALCGPEAVEYTYCPSFYLNNFAVRNLELSFDFSAGSSEKLLELTAQVTWSSIEFFNNLGHSNLIKSFSGVTPKSDIRVDEEII